MKVHKGDTVLVIAGKDKGGKGKVIQAYPADSKVLVEGVNRIKKHVANSYNERGAESGGIVSQEAPIHVSNVMVVDPETKTPTRITTRVETVERDGRTKASRTRVAGRSGKDL